MSYKDIPVSVGKQIAEEFDKDQVVVIAIDHAHDRVHTLTYGENAQDKLIAANWGDFLALVMGLDPEQRQTFAEFRDPDRPEFRQAVEDATADLRRQLAEAQRENKQLRKDVDHVATRLKRHQEKDVTVCHRWTIDALHTALAKTQREIR